jgi:integrase/recombinase XerD
MNEITWNRYPRVAEHAQGRAWLQIQADLQLAPNTISAYGRGLEDYFAFCHGAGIEPQLATRADIAVYVRDLVQRPGPRGPAVRCLDSGAGLANATLQQRLTIVRLFYDYLCEEGCRSDNPVGRGRYTPGKGFAGARNRALIPWFRKLPWIPTEEQWNAILAVTRTEPIRTRVMFALAYDAGLRREELCALATDDLRPGQRLIRIRAETTKNHTERWVPYSTATADLYRSYLAHRRTLSTARGPLFLSESRRNRAQPLSIWTWSKVNTDMSRRAQVPQFTTHTLRHLCLTDLARAHWDLHEIAQFAGHRSTQTTLVYIHLSGRDLLASFERTIHSLHQQRVAQMTEVFQ